MFHTRRFQDDDAVISNGKLDRTQQLPLSRERERDRGC